MTSSIRRKLKGITMAASVPALLLAGAGFIVYDYFSYRQAIAARMESVAKIVGGQSTAALAFNDAKVAGEILQALAVQKQILGACIYDKEGRPFTGYARRDSGPVPAPPRPGPEGTVFHAGHFEIFQAIVSDNDRVGTVYLRSDLEELKERLWRNAAIMGAVLVASILAVFFLVSRLEGKITGPILHLADTVKAVSERKDYSIRAARQGNDETGLLVDGFNEMLSQIQARDAQLEAARRDLEKRVEERTRELKSKEQELIQAQKMEAVGKLAGGVAHDFNNMLTAILGFSDLTLQDGGLDDRARGYLEEIRKAGKRAKSLTAQLLAFSRRQVLQPEVLDLNTLVSDMGGMLRHLLVEDIRLNAELDPSAGRVKADPVQVQQVVLNLVLNARDAMPKGGDLTMRIANAILREPLSWRDETIPPGAYVTLSVNDTGPGLAPEVLPHLFEPFFTTKPKGQGTGLGLSTAYGIVKQSDGWLIAGNAPAGGAAFTIYLPQAIGSSKKPALEASDPRLAPTPGTALLAEDETVVRKLAGELLRRQGFTVVEAADGQEALKAFEAQPDRFDLLVTDVMMPVMGGRELAERAAAIRPSLRILFMSGYTDDTAVRHGIQDKQVNFLPKPFTPARFTAKVRETMGAKP